MKYLPLLCVVAACAAVPASERLEVRGAARPQMTSVNRWYAGNRPPLAPSPFLKLPVGAIEPLGWLRRQLVLQSSGFHGHLGEISRFLAKQDNAWLSPTGEGDHGWEEVPYWLKGFGDCAYLLGEREQIREARVWIEGALASQREDGYFGPRRAQSTVSSTEGEWDLWPNMPMLDALRSYHEFTGDPRVLELMARYFRWELALPDDKFLPPYWQHLRGYDNLWSVYWLYNRTDDPALGADLLALAEKIHRCAGRWEDGVIDWHNVNVCQGFGGPTWFGMQSGDPKHLGSAERNFREFKAKFGQVPGGLFGADENAREGFADPRQAIETCGLVEFMHSCERLIQATGDTLWADRCEDVAFNSLPAALTADLRALRYLTAPNLAASDRQSHSPGFQNGGAMLCYDPHSHRCCQHNFGHGWPYLAEHLWLATPDEGLCLMFPLASAVRARVGAQGREVRLECESRYPFETTFECSVRCDQPTRFPLYVRVPGWCLSVAVGLGDSPPERVEARAGELLRLEREWQAGERVTVRFEAQPSVRRWAANGDSASIDFGPLTYSLEIPSETVRSGGTDAWPAFEILPRGPWNYALVLPQRGDPTQGVVHQPWPADDAPWSAESVPVKLKAKARRVPQWQLDEWALVAPLQQSPVHTAEPIEDITLIPMGAARIRISAFPVAGEDGRGDPWREPR